MNIRIDGLDKLVDSLSKVADDAQIGMSKGLLAAGELVKNDAVENVSSYSSELGKSIIVESLDDTAAVAITMTDKDGIAIEFGTGVKDKSSVSHNTISGESSLSKVTNEKVVNEFEYTTGQAPQPFLAPALFNQKDAVIQAIKNAVLGAI